ncbi:hypothetical protein [Carboxylicivirga sp. RSCT41]|uniref:hypothetical protein n=1 Tax=Carboxylicivirga agarovorans TaxID=3417570 RepID=UPI003D356201
MTKQQIIKAFKSRNIRYNNILLIEELPDHYCICYDFDIQGKKDVVGKNYYFLKKEDVDDGVVVE